MKNKKFNPDMESDGLYVRPAPTVPISVRDKHSDWLQRYRDGQSFAMIARTYGVDAQSVWYVVRKKYGVKS